MAPPHTMSPSKRLRTGPPIKSTESRSLAHARLSNVSYTQSSMPRMPHGVFDETEIINQFRLHRDREFENQPSVEMRSRRDSETHFLYQRAEISYCQLCYYHLQNSERWVIETHHQIRSRPQLRHHDQNAERLDEETAGHRSFFEKG